MQIRARAGKAAFIHNVEKPGNQPAPSNETPAKSVGRKETRPAYGACRKIKILDD